MSGDVGVTSTALENPFLNYRKALEDLSSLWPDARPRELWFDKAFGIYGNPCIVSPYRNIFGSYAALRGKTLRKRARRLVDAMSPQRWRGPEVDNLLLPEDAIVMTLGNNSGIVVVSVKVGLVLKLVYGRSDIEREVRARAIVRAAGIERYSPEIFEHGTTPDGGHWMLTGFVCNSNSIRYPLNPFVDRSKVWRRLLRKEILPVLERFYWVSGLETLHIDDLLAEQRKQLRESDAPEPIWKVAALAEEARPVGDCVKAIRAIVHGDLTPGNVHRQRDQWWLIDWGLSRRDEISVDFIARHFRKVHAPSKRYLAFWEWLRGDLSLQQLPDQFRWDIELFLHWYTSWHGNVGDVYPLRCLLLIHVLRGIQRGIGACGLNELLNSSCNVEDIHHLQCQAQRVVLQLKALGVF